MRAPDVSMRPRGGPKGGSRRSAQTPPVNGSLRSAAVTRSLQASCPAAGRREGLQTKQRTQRPSPAAGAAAASNGRAAPTATELPGVPAPGIAPAVA